MPEPNKKSGCVEESVPFIQLNEPLISCHFIALGHVVSDRPFQVRRYRWN